MAGAWRSRKEGRKRPPAGLRWVDKGASRTRNWCAGSSVVCEYVWCIRKVRKSVDEDVRVGRCPQCKQLHF